MIWMHLEISVPAVWPRPVPAPLHNKAGGPSRVMTLLETF